MKYIVKKLVALGKVLMVVIPLLLSLSALLRFTLERFDLRGYTRAALEATVGPVTFRDWEFRLSPYYNRVSDKIVAIPTSSQFRWTMLNIGVVDVTGLDVKALAGWKAGEWDLGATLRSSYPRALDHSTPGSQTYGNQIPYIPRHSGSVTLEARRGAWSFGWDSSFTGGKWSRTANTPDYYIEPWALSDASVQRAFPLKASGRRGGAPELAVGLALNNVFNTRYEIVQGYPMPGFNAHLSVEYNW